MTASATDRHAAERLAAAGGILTVDLDALAENYREAARAAPGAEAACVIKANGYGLGLEPVARTLGEAGCRTFFVADLAEGERLRAALPDAVIYILDGLFPGTEALFRAQKARPCLSSLAEVEDWARYCAAQGPLPAALHLDTGMNRLGLSEDDAARLAADPSPLRAFELTLTMSHLACADTPADAMNRRQLERFRHRLAQLPPAPASLANTAGLFLGADYHFHMVRAGIGLFGGNPFSGRDNPFGAVVHLEGRIMQVREVVAGDHVGYGAAYAADAPRRIAVVAVGYGDGYFRALGSADGTGAQVAIGGHPAPVVGRVSMDMITVDVTGVPSSALVRGATVELIGRHVSLDDLGRAAGTIGYEILTNLGDRYQRRYTAAGRIS